LLVLQPIEDLSNPDNFLKVLLHGTFKKLSGFYSSAKRCMWEKVVWFQIKHKVPQQSFCFNG